MNIVFISNRLAVVWANLCPPAVATREQPEPKQSSGSAAVFPEHKALPQLKEELLGGCAVPRHDTAVWHSPATQWRATGDVLPAGSFLQPVWSPRGALDSPPVGFQLLKSGGLNTSHVAHGWVPRTFQNSAMPCPHIWSCFGEAGLETLWFSGEAGGGPPHSAFCCQKILPNFTWKILLKRSKNFLSFLQFPCGFTEPASTSRYSTFSSFVSVWRSFANKRTILLPSLT